MEILLRNPFLISCQSFSAFGEKQFKITHNPNPPALSTGNSDFWRTTPPSAPTHNLAWLREVLHQNGMLNAEMRVTPFPHVSKS